MSIRITIITLIVIISQASTGHSALGKIADQLNKYPQRRRTDALRKDDISTVLKNEYGLLFVISITS